MAKTYTPIATQTVSSSVSSVTFSSIPSTYTDLIMVVNGTASTYTDLYYSFNSDSGSNYSRIFMYGSGSTAVSGKDSNITSTPISYLLTTNTSCVVHFLNYSNTTTYKSMVARGGTSEYAALWRSTAAISSMTLTGPSGTISAGSVFTLYGIKAA